MSKLEYHPPIAAKAGHSLADKLLTKIQVETRHMARQKEIAITRMYLRFLEQGYSAEDLVVHQTPMSMVETDPNVFCIQQGVTLRLKDEPWFGHEPVDDACEKARKRNAKDAVGRDGFEPS